MYKIKVFKVRKERFCDFNHHSYIFQISQGATLTVIDSGKTVTEDHTFDEEHVCIICGYEHVHNLTHVPAVAATCTTDGNVEYWHCTGCELNFSNAAGTIEIEDVVIPSPGHSWNEATCVTPKTCSLCGATEGAALGHNFVDGICTRCGYTEAVGGPQIVSQPVDYVGLVGDTATFTVVAEGEGLTYQWYYFDIPADAWKKASGGNTATLTVEFKSYRNNQAYRCEITDADGNTVTTNIAKLTAKAMDLVIVTQPMSYVGSVNDDVTFSLKATGNGLTYQWYYSDDSGATWVLTYMDGYNTDTLHFNATNARAALYMCKITDGSGKIVWTNVVKLQILSAELQILSQPENVTCANGATATFHVEAKGDSLKYQWYSSADGGATWTLSYMDGYNTDTFSFTVNSARASRLYKCVITDAGENTVETNAVSVTIG